MPQDLALHVRQKGLTVLTRLEPFHLVRAKVIQELQPIRARQRDARPSGEFDETETVAERAVLFERKIWRRRHASLVTVATVYWASSITMQLACDRANRASSSRLSIGASPISSTSSATSWLKKYT